MKSQTFPAESAAFRRVAEGLYLYETSGAYYERFRFRGQRIMQRLGEEHHPCTSLPETRRLLHDKKKELELTDVTAVKKTLHQAIKEYLEIMTFGELSKKYKIQYIDELKKAFPATKKVSEIKKTDLLRFLAQFDNPAPVPLSARYNPAKLKKLADRLSAFDVDDLREKG